MNGLQPSEATGQTTGLKTAIEMLPRKQNQDRDGSRAVDETLVASQEQDDLTFTPPSRQDTEMRVGMDPGSLVRTGTSRFSKVVSGRPPSLRMGESSGIESQQGLLNPRRGSLVTQNSFIDTQSSSIDRQITPSIKEKEAPAKSSKQQLA